MGAMNAIEDIHGQSISLIVSSICFFSIPQPSHEGITNNRSAESSALLPKSDLIFSLGCSILSSASIGRRVRELSSLCMALNIRCRHVPEACELMWMMVFGRFIYCLVW